MRRQDFDGDDAVEARVAGAVNLAHPACANCRENFARAEALARQKPHLFQLELAKDNSENRFKRRLFVWRIPFS